MIDLANFNFNHQNGDCIEYHLQASCYSNGNLALTFLGKKLNVMDKYDFDQYLQAWNTLSVNVIQNLSYNEFVVHHDFDLDLLKFLILELKYLEDTGKRVGYGYVAGNPILKLNERLSKLIRNANE
jgi:hypothetical protein